MAERQGTVIKGREKGGPEEERRRFAARRKIIAFDLGGEIYGIDIDKVKSIMEPRPVMPLPGTSLFILGLINLRGSLLPLLDLRLKFNLERPPLTDESRIVVVVAGGLKAGILVDRVWELLRLPLKAFQPAPAGVAKIDSEYFLEVCPVGGRMLIILDIERLLRDTAGEEGLPRLSGKNRRSA